VKVIAAWSLLDHAGIIALLSAGNLPPGIQVAEQIDAAGLQDVPILHSVRRIIARARANDCLKLTAGGALSRADTKALSEELEWPDHDRAAILAVNRVLNEEDVHPVHFSRLVAQEAKLFRRYKGRLLAAKRGVALCEPGRAADLFRALFESAFWRLNLAYFDRVPVDHWPQSHIGVVLWCLSVAAHDWSDPETLVTSCTMPDPEFQGRPADFRGFAMETRVLRPLSAFGTLEVQKVGHPTLTGVSQRLYRKSPLFDQVLKFTVAMRDAPRTVQ
jgi:hypothetical protein